MQTSKLTQKPVAEVLAAIAALDLTSVKIRLMDPKLGEGWTREYADSIEAAFKNYLSMAVKYQEHAEDLLLSEDVDEFWHTYILQTLKYADDCQAVFGTFLHHSPHIGEVTQADHDRRAVLAEKTRELYEREFGSAREADAAWAGHTGTAGEPAMSGIAFTAGKAAMSGMAIGAGNAAMSGLAIRSEKAAMSGIAIRAGNAAMSGMAIRSGKAAMSGIAIRAGNAAMSGLAIRADKAAMSGIAVRPANATTSDAAIQPQNAAMSGIAIRR